MIKKWFLYIIFAMLFIFLVAYDYFSFFKTDSFVAQKLDSEFNISTINSYKIEESLIFSNEYWAVKTKDSNKSTKNIQNSESKKNKKFQIVIKKEKYPINICIDTTCYQFLAISNSEAYFYLNEKNKENFFSLKKDECLNERLCLKNILPTKLDFYDKREKKRYYIKMFNIDTSKYKPKQEKE